MNIFAVKNYESESECDVNIEILALMALKGMLHIGSDFQQHATASGES